MLIIKPSVKLLSITSDAEKVIEKAGRVCYKSEAKITEDSHIAFIKNLIKREHEAVLEHASASLLFICDRGILAELTRHRLASFCAESTRYVNYKDGIEVIAPCFWKDNIQARVQWENSMLFAEQTYKKLIDLGATPQEARTVLPTSLKTEIAVTANIRQWRHIIRLRTSQFSHPQIREVMEMALDLLKQYCPILFEDL